MATIYTANYNLGKQENHADKFNMNILTENMDKIDAQMKANADNIAEKLSITDIDSELDVSSENPVQNKAAAEAIEKIQTQLEALEERISALEKIKSEEERR